MTNCKLPDFNTVIKTRKPAITNSTDARTRFLTETSLRQSTIIYRAEKSYPSNTLSYYREKTV